VYFNFLLSLLYTNIHWSNIGCVIDGGTAETLSLRTTE